ncbi:MAG: ferrochelatase [Chitinophagaceae bacterium]
MAEAVKRGVMLMNLGSPDSTEVKDVTRYLKEFLMDERVIDYNWLARTLLVKGLIVPFRAPKSAAAYKTIWTKDGSPLVVLTKQLQEALQKQIPEKVVVSMRYGNPNPEAAFEELLKKEPGLEEVILVPLYPHYAMSSYETAVEHVMNTYKKKKYSFAINTVKPFYDEPHYIGAMVENMRPYLQQDYDHILFSYHGIPERHIRKSDTTGKHCLQVHDCCNVPSTAHATCYRHQVFDTTKRIVEALQIPEGKYSLSFQSRLGKGWLQPFTDVRFEEMPKEGVKKILVISPAFVSDCLETLEELEERGRESFIHAGGESFTMIPCLNLHPLWVNAIAGWIKDYAAGDKTLVQ